MSSNIMKLFDTAPDVVKSWVKDNLDKLRGLDSPYLTPNEAARRLRTTYGYLANMRMKDQGPKVTRIGGKVFYHIDDVKEYERRG